MRSSHLEETQFEIDAKALDNPMADRQAEVKVKKLGDNSQRQI